MNYITCLINRKIKFLESANKSNELKVHYQSKLEYYLLLLLSYFFNKNYLKIGEEEREKILVSIMKPTIGTIVEIARNLDVDHEIFMNRKYKTMLNSINKYPSFRNEIIGHGYSFEDNVENFNKIIKELLDSIDNSNLEILTQEADIICVEKKENNIFYGITYNSNGDYSAWQCPEEVFEFKVSCLYIHYLEKNLYVKISPFIHIEDESSIYVFSSVEEKLTGRAKYNKLISTGTNTFEMQDFQSIVVASDSNKVKHINGTIVNKFDNNYKTYINVGYDQEILKFLKNNASSVYATLWGHGGVGKTATIQHVIDILCQEPIKTFDYVIFLSAKDRLYNYYKGTIEDVVTERISSLAQIILYLNKIVFGIESFEKDNILNYRGKLFLIIDDFETFSEEEKKSIMSFINELDINHHKVVITTRSAFLVSGAEIQTSELDPEKTIKFLKDVLQNEYSSYNISIIESDLQDEEIIKQIHLITSGRPLFILQLAVLLIQYKGIREVLTQKIKTSESAVMFLYDRIMEYLSVNAKNMFLAIGLMADKIDLSGLLSNLRYVLNMEDKEDDFYNSLMELVKLKIITIDDKFFKLYSQEIYDLTNSYYQKKPSTYDGGITSRYNAIADRKELDTDLALLEVADSSRIMKNDVEIENKYRHILNRRQSSSETKMKAVFNYSYYLSTNGQVGKAIKVYEDFYPIFSKEYEYVVNYAKCLWLSNDNEDHKNMSISILKEYIEKTQIERDPNEIEHFLVLLSYCLVRSTVLVTEKKERLKDLKVLEDIDDETYASDTKTIRLSMNQIFRSYATKLYFGIKKININKLSAPSRFNILNGMNSYMELALRLDKLNFAKEACLKVIKEFPESMTKQFVLRLKTIEFFEKRRTEKIEPVTESLSVLGIKLKEAFEKKRIGNH